MSKDTEKPLERKLIRLDLPPEQHAEVRVAAARKGVPMADFARVAVVEAARKVNRGKP